MDDVNTDGLPATPSAETPADGTSDASELELELEPEGAGDGQLEGEDELEDWEEDGKTHKVAKALKPHLLRNKDYSQKTMELAEQRKADEAARKDFAEEQKFHRENIASVAKITNLDEQLAAFRAITPEQWAQMDADKASKLQIKFNLLKDQRDTAFGELRQKQHQALEKQRTTFAKQFEDGQARIAAKIPGWSDEFAGKLTAYGVENGLSMEELEGFIPRKNAEAYVGVLRKAYLYDQLVAKQRARAASPKDEAPAPTPVPKLSARRNSPSSEPLDSDPVDVWREKREKQLAGKRAR